MDVLESIYYLSPACVLCQAAAAGLMWLPTMLQPAAAAAVGPEAAGTAGPEEAAGAEGRWVAVLVLCSMALGVVVNTASLLVRGGPPAPHLATLRTPQRLSLCTGRQC